MQFGQNFHSLPKIAQQTGILTHVPNVELPFEARTKPDNKMEKPVEQQMLDIVLGLRGTFF